MYEDMMKDVHTKMKPVTDMAEINKTTAEKLISLQTEYVTDLFNSGLAQMKALSEVKEPKAAIELQVKYFKDLEAKLTNVAEKEIATLTSAKEQLTELVEKGVSEMSDVPAMADVTKFMQTAQEKMTELTETPVVAEMTKFMQTAQEQMTEAAKAFTPEVVAPKAAPAPAAPKAAPAAAAPKAAPKAAARKAN
ncbi:phasin family protein [Neptunomonas qingdaonensis]|uniref:Phasin family protein n=1 Tax=Neptunomonas qingdaonensis TaxID=1045558 RepID=A0A1I2SZ48_9GAMM|nr:phasin family protein [Neptunomonas qingdaonensis]SFG57908.1 phasin family protein [Neptunomonas qingdaonensis]